MRGIQPEGYEPRVFAECELRVAGDGEERKIVGHAAVFNSLSQNLGGFQEKIARGTFQETIANDDVRALFNHSPDMVLGRNRAGTLRLAEDQTGLAIEIDPPDTQVSRDLMQSIGRGDISQMSFGFRTLKDEWDMEPDPPVRTLQKVRLFDVSPVTFPAYTSTDVAVRSLEAARQAAAPGAQTVAVMLEARITALEEPDNSRADIIAQCAREIGVSVNAMDQVLTGELRGLDHEALVLLGATLGLRGCDLIAAAEAEGFDYRNGEAVAEQGDPIVAWHIRADAYAAQGASLDMRRRKLALVT